MIELDLIELGISSSWSQEWLGFSTIEEYIFVGCLRIYAKIQTWQTHKWKFK